MMPMSPEEWSAFARQATDPDAGLDPFTLRMVVQSLRRRAASLPFGANRRPWDGAADHVQAMLEKAK